MLESSPPAAPGLAPLAVGSVMSASVHTLGPDAPLSEARELMHAHGIRHLPVTREGRVLGVVTLSDLYAAEAIIQADPDETPVETIMAQDVFTVGSGAPLAEVAAEMARRRLGSALVVDGGELVGLFTSSDACQVLARLLGPSH